MTRIAYMKRVAIEFVIMFSIVHFLSCGSSTEHPLVAEPTISEPTPVTKEEYFKLIKYCMKTEECSGNLNTGAKLLKGVWRWGYPEDLKESIMLWRICSEEISRSASDVSVLEEATLFWPLINKASVVRTYEKLSMESKEEAKKDEDIIVDEILWDELKVNASTLSNNLSVLPPAAQDKLVHICVGPCNESFKRLSRVDLEVLWLARRAQLARFLGMPTSNFDAEEILSSWALNSEWLDRKNP